jgi:hypothetical protein
MKLCAKCNVVKSKFLFSLDNASKDKLRTICKKCDAAYKSNWRKNNPHKHSATNARHYAKKLERMLTWGKQHLKPEIENWYKRAKLATIFMREPYEVDHIEPLRGKDVCGLHVPWNLTLLTKAENLSKGNRRVKSDATASVPAGPDQQGEVYPELGTFFATGTRQDSYDFDHYQRTVSGQDADYRTQTRGGDGVGRGSEEVGAPASIESKQDNWQLHPTYGWIER